MEHLSKAKLKLFGSLLVKKYREREGLFLAEGVKMAEEAIRHGGVVEALLCSEAASGQTREWLESMLPGKCFITSEAEFARLSGQVTPEGVAAVVRMPIPPLAPDQLSSGPWLLLEAIHDPGNLGTLIRSAEWFGFRGVICSPGTADAYNPKALRASMGSIFRIPLMYPDHFNDLVRSNASQIWVADADGESIGEVGIRDRAAILIGSESHGPSKEVLGLPGIRTLAIPGYGKGESLNAAIAGSILAFAWRQA